MNDKVLLNVFLPATQRSYEFRVPYDMTVDESVDLIGNILASREPARYTNNGEADLILMDQGELGVGVTLNPNETLRALVEQQTLFNGSRVIIA